MRVFKGMLVYINLVRQTKKKKNQQNEEIHYGCFVSTVYNYLGVGENWKHQNGIEAVGPSDSHNCCGGHFFLANAAAMPPAMSPTAVAVIPIPITPSACRNMFQQGGSLVQNDGEAS